MNIKSVLRMVIGLLLVAGTAFVVANAYDYFRFTQAVARATRLNQQELAALGDFAKSITRENAGAPKDIPPAFRSLKPNKVFLIPGFSSASLYKLGDIYLEFRVETSPENQHILFFTNSAGQQKTTSLWHRDPALVEKLSPQNRILSITRTIMHGSTEWIVVPDQIMVIHHSFLSGEGDTLVATSSLAPADRALIEAAIRAIAPEAHGKVYRTSVMDGVSLGIRFSADGQKSKDDIVVENAWTETIGPLLEVVPRFSPKENPIGFKQEILDEDFSARGPMTVQSLREWSARREQRPTTPWWCVWRSLVN